MTKECFVPKTFRDDSLSKIQKANEIVEEYQEQNLRLTLRQLYYQFVSKNLIPNSEKSYKNLASLISDARLAGLIDWDAIEDRGRVPDVPSVWDGIPSLVKSALRAYQRDRWEGQPIYVELWVEKQALAGVLEPLAREYRVTLMANKGYSSQSSMYEAAQRFHLQTERYGKSHTLLYLGDHDPSGEDMVRDIEDRLQTFRVADLQVEKLALTMEQIRRYNPPPQPAKTSDVRFEGYEAKHGNQSWELDAIDPQRLQALVRTALNECIHRPDLMKRVIEREKAEKAALSELVKSFDWAKFEDEDES